MPIPKPRDNEEEDEFIKRCMSNDTMVEEYPDNEQRLAICYTSWRRAREGKAMEHKSTQIELKADKQGTFTARIATLNVIDRDGDVTLPGAFPEGKTVLVSAYQHGSWMGELPVGKAVIKEVKDEVLAEGEFNLNTQHGKDHYEAVKFAGGLQEWSYGFEVKEAEQGVVDGQDVRFLKMVDVFEISPVLLGSGIDTATLAIKSQAQERLELEGTTYLDQAERTLAAVTALIDRTKSLADLRRKEGRILSTANRERIKGLLDALTGVASDLTKLLDATMPEADKALRSWLLGVKEKIKFLEGIVR